MLNGKAASLLAGVLSGTHVPRRPHPTRLLVAVLRPQPAEPLSLLLEGPVFLRIDTFRHELVHALFCLLSLPFLLHLILTVLRDAFLAGYMVDLFSLVEACFYFTGFGLRFNDAK